MLLFFYYPGVTSQKFLKKERLKSKKAIDHLFRLRQSVHVYPLRLIWGKIEPPLSSSPIQFAVSVPKKSFPLAVNRNRIKRIIREVYRLNKQAIYEKLENKEIQYGWIFIYTGHKEPAFQELEIVLHKITKKVLKRLD